MDKRITESFDTQMASFRLMIRITQYLDATIALYRPDPTYPEEAFGRNGQIFEDLVASVEALNIGNALLGRYISTDDKFKN